MIMHSYDGMPLVRVGRTEPGEDVGIFSILLDLVKECHHLLHFVPGREMDEDEGDGRICRDEIFEIVPMGVGALAGQVLRRMRTEKC